MERCALIIHDGIDGGLALEELANTFEIALGGMIAQLLADFQPVFLIDNGSVLKEQVADFVVVIEHSILERIVALFVSKIDVCIFG